MNDKRAKLLRRAAKKLAPRHYPQRIWYDVGSKDKNRSFQMCVVGDCVRGLYRRLKKYDHLLKEEHSNA